MPRRSRSRSPQRRRRHSDSEREHRRKEERARRQSLQSHDQAERVEGDAKPRRRKFVEYPEKSSTARSPQERRDDVAEDGKQGQERDRGEGGGEERKRTSKFREERAERPSEKERGWDQQWREERQRRGRGRDWRGGRNWRASRNGEKGPPPTGEGEEGGEENEQGNSRLQSSLIDPREVPRKGLFYEHDDREAPTDRGQAAPRRRFSDTRPSSDRTRGRREPRHKSFSGDDRGWREEREGRERRGERRERESRRGEREGRGERDHRRRGERQEDLDRRERPERRARRSPARWRHDLFEDDSENIANTTSEGVNKDKKSSDADVKWAHDKFEELLKMDEQEGSMKVDENNHEEMELVKMEV